MHNQTKRRARPGWRSTAPLLVALLMLSGCGSWLKTGAPSQAQREAYQEQMELTTRELNAANLDQARVHASKAREQAWGDDQVQKVESLECLIAGAEALQDGDTELAELEWSRITDPALKREVSIKARAIGIDMQNAMPNNGKEGRK